MDLSVGGKNATHTDYLYIIIVAFLKWAAQLYLCNPKVASQTFVNGFIYQQMNKYHSQYQTRLANHQVPTTDDRQYYMKELSYFVKPSIHLGESVLINWNPALLVNGATKQVQLVKADPFDSHPVQFLKAIGMFDFLLGGDTFASKCKASAQWTSQGSSLEITILSYVLQRAILIFTDDLKIISKDQPKLYPLITAPPTSDFDQSNLVKLTTLSKKANKKDFVGLYAGANYEINTRFTLPPVYVFYQSSNDGAGHHVGHYDALLPLYE